MEKEISSYPPLSLTAVSVGYRHPIATNLDLTVKSGEFVTIMGENGSGKTTLVDCIFGRRSPLSGDIRFWGRENQLRNRKVINSKVGWVISQSESYPLFVTVERLLRKVSLAYETWNWTLCERLMREFKLEPTKPARHLSLGEHSKIRLIKALSFEPELLVLDELTANLSPSSKDAIIAALIDLFSTREMSVLYVSHSNEESIKLSDRIFRMTDAGLQPMGGQYVD